MKKCIHISFFLLPLMFLAAAQAGAQTSAWVQQGETLRFNITWWGMTAGGAELRYLPENTLEDAKAGQNPYTLIVRSWNTPGIRGIFQMRDRILVEGVHDLSRSQYFLPRKVNVRLNENDYKADKLVVYDQATKTASYTNKRAAHEPTKEAEITDITRDFFSALYALRVTAKNLEPGKLYEMPMHNLDRMEMLRLKVVEKDKRDTIFGENTPVWHVQPVRIEKSGETKKRLHLWVTADEKRIPVAIQVKLGIGSFTGTLVGRGDGSAQTEAPADLPMQGDFTIKKKALPHANPIPD